MRLVVKNFQSIESANLEVSGLTIITGPSNRGKSALLRAVRAAVFGRPGEDYIRRGTQQCGVAIRDTGLELEWRKVTQAGKTPGRETSLTINGERYTKISKEQANLVEPLGFKEIKTSTKRYRPQFATQMEGPFLISETDGDIAEALKTLGRVDQVQEAHLQAKKDRRKIELAIKLREEELQLKKAKTEEAKKKADAYITIVKLAQTYLKEAKTKITALSETKAKVQKLTQLQPRALPKSPDLLGPVAEKFMTLLAVRKRLTLDPKTLPNDPPSVDLQEKLTLRGKIERYQQLKAAKLPAVPSVAVVPGMLSLEKGRKLYQCLQEISQIKENVSQIHLQLSQLDQQIKRMEEEMGICPTCGRKFGLLNHEHPEN